MVYQILVIFTFFKDMNFRNIYRTSGSEIDLACINATIVSNVESNNI